MQVEVRQLTHVSKRKRGAESHFEFPEKMQFVIKIGDTELPVDLAKHATMTTDVKLFDDNGRLNQDLWVSIRSLLYSSS